MIDLPLLDDQTSQRILTTIAYARSRNIPHNEQDLRQALTESFGAPTSKQNVAPGDLARQALILLAEDPATLLAIESIASEDKTATTYSYGGGTTIAIAFAAYFALGTALDIERDKQGKWFQNETQTSKFRRSQETHREAGELSPWLASANQKLRSQHFTRASMPRPTKSTSRLNATNRCASLSPRVFSAYPQQ